MPARSLGYATDLALLVADGGVVTRHDGYAVVRAPGHPGYYWGNFLLMDAPPGPGDDARWPALFRDAFGDDPAIRHFTFGWDDPTGVPGERAPFLAAGYVAHDGVVLTATAATLRPPRHPRPDLVVRPLASDADWEAATLNQLATREPGHGAAEYERFKRARMAAYRAMAARGHGAWFGAFAGDRLVGDLGIFVADGLARFQAVGTAPDMRRQGVCAALVHGASRHALAHMGVTTLVIVAEPDGEAGRVYGSLGYAATERQAGMCWWPYSGP